MTDAVGKGLQHPSGRVIGLGRLMLAVLFVVAILIDSSQPAHAPAATYSLLSFYVLFALAIVMTTWRNWWLDARLAGPVHAVDIVVFSLLVLLTEGYTSPFFPFFMFLLLSAAIRWQWRATALTAVLLTLLYLVMGLIAFSSGVEFELQRFVVRTGQLVTLSLIVIWFGANQRRAWPGAGAIPSDARHLPADSPLETGLLAAMTGLGAERGLFVWRGDDRADCSVISIGGNLAGPVALPAGAIVIPATAPFLYDFGKDRALRFNQVRDFIYFRATEAILPGAAAAIGLGEGLAVPVRLDRADGLLFLEGLRSLSTDHLDIAEVVSAEAAGRVQRYALLKAAEESAESRSRLTLARDLHDSVVQFLAGAAFRVEAVKRSHAAGRDVEDELNELKQLMLQEQRELRGFITALRGGPLVAFGDLIGDLQLLAERLARQWDVACELVAQPADLMVPTQLRLDANQLMREAVANAVRHAAAKMITIKVSATPDRLDLEAINDGADFKLRGGRREVPASLKERVAQAGGTLDLARGMGTTRISISLPIAGFGR